jgi:hypothetical protein
VPAAYFYDAPRYHKGIDFAGGEMPGIFMRGEEVGWPKDLAEKYGGNSRGGTTITINNPNFANPNFADRRSVGQLMARLSQAAKPMKRAHFVLAARSSRGAALPLPERFSFNLMPLTPTCWRSHG